MRTLDLNSIYDVNGGVYVAGTSANTGPFSGIIAHTDTVIASLTCAKWTGPPASVTVKAGAFLMFPGGATAVTLTSGTCTLINRPASQ